MIEFFCARVWPPSRGVRYQRRSAVDLRQSSHWVRGETGSTGPEAKPVPASEGKTGKFYHEAGRIGSSAHEPKSLPSAEIKIGKFFQEGELCSRESATSILPSNQ